MPIRLLCLAALVLALLAPAAARAQAATVVAEFDVGQASPGALYDALLASTFPAELVPEGVGPLTTYPWRDSNDRDLAGSLGGVIFADGDPGASAYPHAITYLVYPDASGPVAQWEAVSEMGAPVELVATGQLVPGMAADLGDAVGVFVVIDNVLVYSLASVVVAEESSESPAPSLAGALAVAGIEHLVEVSQTVAATGSPVAASGATPVVGTMPVDDPWLAMATAAFPPEDIPFPVGELVTLPMETGAWERDAGLVGALLVRDAGRVYPYPLVIYRFFTDESAALDDVSAIVRRAGGMEAVTALPAGVELPYPTTLLDPGDGSATVLVQVESTVVSASAYGTDAAARQRGAMILARIAVEHLEQVLDLAGE